MKLKNNEKGIGLIETILAMGIAVIILTSMVSLSVFTLHSSLQNKLLLSGTQLADQEIELVRAYRDTNAWETFVADVDGTNGVNCFTADCYMDNAGSLNIRNGINTINSGTPEQIQKSFRLTDVDGDKSVIKVAVNVSWKVGSDTKYAHNYTELSDWRGL